MVEIPVPAFELVTRVEVELGALRSLGQSQWGQRRVVPIAGGTFDGPLLRGRVLPGGADWQVVHADGMISVDARYTLETNDGAGIYAQSRGVRYGSPEVLARLGAGEAVDPAEYYFRAEIQLETGAPDYLWVNRRLFVASAMRLAQTVVYDLYAIS